VRVHALAFAALSWAANASAQTPARTATCVEVITASDGAEALRRLVESEVDRHASHHAVREGCLSYLRVELLELASADGGGRFLTGRINEQVPERVRVDDKGLTPALERLLTVVLHNDPVRLRGPVTRTWFGEQGQAFVRGQNRYAVEAFELLAPLAGALSTSPGLMLSARREMRAWYLGLRLGSAFSPSPDDERVALSLWVRSELEAGLFANPAGGTSFFAALLLGAEYQRFRGPAPLLGPGAQGTAVSGGFAPGLRAGLELLRVAETRVTLFAQVGLPLFVSSDPDGGVVDQWLPTAAIGGGGGF
jgi:hypothetical protein